ncbi:MAG: LamG domain-containing protein [Candidatus Omnitrophica bacterium]|nr:LamG domain-containing protein [Candidatus Omnitrophota bacterium]
MEALVNSNNLPGRSRSCYRLGLIALVLIGWTAQARAKVDIIADYRLGASTPQVTYTGGPETMADSTGNNHQLKREGNPRFVASAPVVPSAKGAGALEFDGKSDAYVRTGALFDGTDCFGIEVWVSAGEASVQGLKGVVANGNGARGYVLGQSGSRWVAFVGCVGAFDAGPVTPGKWTHLALVNDGNDLAVYRDGEKIRSVSPTPAIEPVFRIGTAGLPEEHFKGLIHCVRVFTFAPGGFEPDHDFLLDNELRQKAAQQDRVEQAAFIRRLCQAQPGVLVVKKLNPQAAPGDWLIAQADQPAQLEVEPAADGQSARLALCNGLISRSFYAGRNLACFSYRNLRNRAEFIRAVKPEMRIKLDGVWYEVGGLIGQPERAYLVESWLKDMKSSPNQFRFTGFTTARPIERYPWKPKFNAPNVPWPPKGLRVSMHYAPPEALASRYGNLKLTVHYEMYEGLPVLSKSFTLENDDGEPVLVDEIETEILAVPQDQIENIHAESNYSFHIVNHSPDDCHASGAHSKAINWDTPLYLAGRTTTDWRVDPELDSWAHPTAIEDKFLGHTFRNLMVSRIPVGPAKLVPPGRSFESHITFELLQDSSDRERRSLGVRRMYRALCPQVSESLLTAGSPSHDPTVIKNLIDQMGELGFEGYCVTCWPGISYENLEPAYVAKWKAMADYAKTRGIIMSGYELMVASRGRGAEVDCIDPATGKPGSPFGQSVCLGTKWADDFFSRVWRFIDQTGFMGIAVDGPYHGCPCASTVHKYHRGLADSQWAQWQCQTKMFAEEQRRGMFAPAPDWYIWNGASCTSLGYREASANLPRELGLLLYRQYIYDGTWFKPPTMGGMGIGLIGTYTDDPRAMLEPLDKNLEWYELNIVQLLGSGCQANFRANRLYDTERTRLMVRKWISWYKKYRPILSSDIIHVQRPDGRDMDCIFHVNPALEQKGLALFFNPLDESITRKMRLPLYYTGLSDTVLVREQEKDEAKLYKLNRDYSVEFEVTLPPRGVTWFVLTDSAQNPSRQ